MIRCHLIYSKAYKKLSQNRSENIFSRWSEFLRLWVVEVWDSNNDWHVDCFIRTSLPRNLTHYGAPSTKTIFSGRTCVKKKTQHTDIWRKLILIQWTDIKMSKWQQIVNLSTTVEIHRLDQWILDWTAAVAGEADRELTSVSFPCHSSAPI